MKVYWTRFALKSLQEIFDYYKNCASILIANRIKESIFQSVRQLESYPLSGTREVLLQELNEGHRYIIRGNYKVIYKVISKKIFITDVFDMRQNPSKIYRNSESSSKLNEPQTKY